MVLGIATTMSVIALPDALAVTRHKPSSTIGKRPPAIPKAATPKASPVAIVAPPQAKPIGKPGDWFPLDSYPSSARALGQEGRTAFALDIDARGRITACHIMATSGSDLLDSTTCSQLIANGRFEPAHDVSGKPVAGQWRSAMRWQLQVGASSEPEQ